jgi:hypothetical protein
MASAAYAPDILVVNAITNMYTLRHDPRWISDTVNCLRVKGDIVPAGLSNARYTYVSFFSCAFEHVSAKPTHDSILELAFCYLLPSARPQYLFIVLILT